MWRRLSTLGLGLVLALSFTPAPGHAQLGGLVKKAKDKAATSAGVQTSTDQPARLPGPEITPTVVDHFLAGLKVEKVARERAAANAEQEKKDEQKRKEKEAMANLDPQTRHYMCVNEKQQGDPRYADFQKLSKEAQEAGKKGDNSKVLELTVQMNDMQIAMQQRADSLCVLEEAKAGASPSREQKAIQDAPTVPPEEAGAKAAAMPVLDYGQVKELIYTYLNYGKRAGVTESEKKAIDAKAKDLKEGLKGIGLN